LDPEESVDYVVGDGNSLLIDTDLDGSGSTEVDTVLDVQTLFNPLKRNLVVAV